MVIISKTLEYLCLLHITLKKLKKMKTIQIPRFRKFRAIVSMVIFLLGLLGNVSAQAFLTPVSAIQGPAEVVTKKGETVSGKLKGGVIGTKGLVKFGLKPLSGKKIKFKSTQVESVKIKLSGLAKMEIISDQMSTFKKLKNADFSEATQREYVYYNQVKIPNKKGKLVLAQLLNAGFDQHIKVYHNPAAKTGKTRVLGVAVGGDNIKGYYVVKHGGETIKVMRAAYAKKHFEALFGDCEEMMQFEQKDRKFKYMAEHVAYYNQMCKKS